MKYFLKSFFTAELLNSCAYASSQLLKLLLVRQLKTMNLIKAAMLNCTAEGVLNLLSGQADQRRGDRRSIAWRDLRATCILIHVRWTDLMAFFQRLTAIQFKCYGFGNVLAHVASKSLSATRSPIFQQQDEIQCTSHAATLERPNS